MIDTTAGSARAENRRGRAAHITLWVLQVIGAAFMLGAAYPKFIGTPDMVELYRQIGIGQWFRLLTGVLETLGGIALLIPRLRAVGAVALCGLLIGAVTTNFRSEHATRTRDCSPGFHGGHRGRPQARADPCVDPRTPHQVTDESDLPVPRTDPSREESLRSGDGRSPGRGRVSVRDGGCASTVTDLAPGKTFRRMG